MSQGFSLNRQDTLERLDRVQTWLGETWDDRTVARLLRFAEWLGTEAVEAGGIGPHEPDRLIDRHVADSLTLARWIPNEGTVVDIGSGVGLPGIPLAIIRPDAEMSLVDRAGRRVDLARRAVRILDLDNIEVLQTDVAELTEPFDIWTFRASLPVMEAALSFADRAESGNTALFALSRTIDDPPVPPEVAGVKCSVEMIPDEVLDSVSWVLRMRRT